MKKFAFVLLLLATALTSHAAEYQQDWNYKNFYEAVNICRSSIIFPAALDYEKKGLASKQTKEVLRNETIAITPATENIASEACYCALNEYAKDKLNAELVRNWESVAPYMATPRCKEKMEKSMKLMPQEIKTRMLK